MENTKFTQKKWVQNGVNGLHTVNGSCIALTYGENAKYNAVLISKAPEMLYMLKELINLHELGHEIGQYDKARELIKEATEI